MKPCVDLNDYLDKRLPTHAISQFESHLSSCTGCHEVVAFWEKAEQDLKWADDHTEEWQPTERDVVRLMERARTAAFDETLLPDRRENRQMLVSRWALQGTFALLLALGVGLGGFLATQMRPSPPSAVDSKPLDADDRTKTRRHPESSRAVTAPSNDKWVVDLGPHRLGLTPLSQINIHESDNVKDEVRIRIRLDGGTVACAVSPLRRGAFLVESGDFIVRVIGTRFLVTRLGPFGIRVSVSEGRVSVQRGTEHWQVSKGERLDVTHSGPAETSVMATWEAEEWETLFGYSERVKPVQSARIALRQDDETSLSDTVPILANKMTAKQPIQTSPYSVERPSRTTASQDGPSSPALALPPNDPSVDTDIAAIAREISDWPEPPAYAPVTESRSAPSPGNTSDAAETHAQKLSRWRQWVIDGMYGDAEAALVEYLKGVPQDTQARYLLADCRRKSGDVRGAVTAYLDIATTATPSQATRARFMAGALLQDTLNDYPRALKQFEAYLSAPPAYVVLKDIARLRLAQCLTSLGQRALAQKQIELLLRDCADPLTEAKAHRLLDSLK